jgi:hypothetical protein
MSEIRAATVSNVAGTGPVTLTGQYAAKAWVNFNGTGTVAIRESGNVSSITDNGAGDYTVNFTTALTDANYSTNISATAPVNDQHVVPFICDTSISGGALVYTTTQVRFVHINVTNSSAKADPLVVGVSIHR